MKRIRIPLSNVKTYSFSDSFFSIGSCFSENAAKYLSSFGVKTFSNPFGAVYNSHSIYQQL
ncbi:MAG: GSCFA domain-containing protein, partial [Spirochaetales bacterium]|nr:GSCFA domain-containing protein [Spirochaetales bacterium]